MAALTYYWHDYETFGVNPRLDRPSQFAGQRTDADLNPIGEPLTLYCQPCDDVLPHPEACLLTGITPQIARDRGVPEPEFIAQIINELGQPGTCGVGYNSLRFDDEVTRHTAWRNFIDPYAREWRDGCSRWDIIDMVRLTYALRPDGIEWPTRDDGLPSFRLEDLAEANGLSKARAHDALSDVHTTIDLARLVHDKQPKLFDYAANNRDKRSATAMIDLREHTPVLHVSEKFGAQHGCISLVMPLAADPTNDKKIACYDLRHAPDDLLELPAEDVYERLFTPRAELPEGIERIAIKHVHLNKCPVLVPVKTINDAQAERVALDLAACREHWKQLHDHLPQVQAKLAAVALMSDFEPHSDAEQDLYGGFVNDADRRLCNQVLAMAPAEFDDLDLPFEDKRLHELLFRFRARHHPESLNEAEREEWQNWRNNRIEFAPDGGLTLDEFDATVSALQQRVGDDADARSLLADLSEWGQKLRASL